MPQALTILARTNTRNITQIQANTKNAIVTPRSDFARCFILIAIIGLASEDVTRLKPPGFGLLYIFRCATTISRFVPSLHQIPKTYGVCPVFRSA